MCKGCLCMTCGVWEDCPTFARCEELEIASCEQRTVCSFYQRQETKQNNQTKGVKQNEMV